jgi:DNA-binding XRE family transcriptional regulator
LSVTPDTEEGKTARRVISRHEEVRRRFGYTVTELAAAIGFSHATVSRIEGGTLKPSARYRAAVSRLLGVPEELIFEREGVNPS